MTEPTGVKELAEFAHDLGRKDKNINVSMLDRYNEKTPVALIPEGMEIKDLREYLPDHPVFKDLDLKLYDPESFVRYVREHKHEFTRIFASIESAPYEFNAIIDFHGTSGQPADWCKHQVVLQLKLSEQFKVWKSKNNEFFTQAEFAEFLKDNRLDIVEPNNAEILTMAMGLEANVESRCTSKLPTNQGTQLSFTEEVNTRVNGEKVSVPSSLKLYLPVFLGGEAFEIEADFKMRTREGQIFFAYRMLGVDKLLRDTVANMAKKLENETGVPVYI